MHRLHYHGQGLCLLPEPKSNLSVSLILLFGLMSKLASYYDYIIISSTYFRSQSSSEEIIEIIRENAMKATTPPKCIGGRLIQ